MSMFRLRGKAHPPPNPPQEENMEAATVKDVFLYFQPQQIIESIKTTLRIIQNLFDLFDQKELRENATACRDNVTKAILMLNQIGEIFNWTDNAKNSVKEWPAEKQNDVLIALLLLKYDLATFEKEVFDTVGERKQISSDSVKKHLEKIDKWVDVTEAIRRSSGFPPVDSRRVTIELKNIFSGKEVDFVTRIVKTKTGKAMESRSVESFKKGIDYSQIKFEKDRLVFTNTETESNAELRFGNLTVDPKEQWTRTILASRSRTLTSIPSSSSVERLDHVINGLHTIPVRVDIVNITKNDRKNNLDEKLAKLATVLSEQHWHANILKFLGVIEILDLKGHAPEVRAMYMLSDGRCTTTLKDVLKPNYPEKFSVIDGLDILFGVADAISYLHGIHIYHKCIDDSSIIIEKGENGPVSKITNFGQSRLSSVRSTPPQHVAAPSIWLAPNYEPGTTKYDYSDDVYSLGVVMFAVGAWMDMEDVVRLKDVMVKGEELCKNKYGSDFLDSMMECLQVKPALRPEAKFVRIMLEDIQNKTKVK